MSAVVAHPSSVAVAAARPAVDVPIGVDRAGVRHGFALILLSLLGGVLTPFLVNPRMGVGAHTLGVLGGLVLIAFAATASAFMLSPELRRTMRNCWLSAAYLNWAGTLFAGATGASFLTPIAGAGTIGSMAAEVTVIVVYVTVGITSVAGTLIAIYGLRDNT
jgi:(hydroxyamino)benzene mutase